MILNHVLRHFSDLKNNTKLMYIILNGKGSSNWNGKGSFNWNGKGESSLLWFTLIYTLFCLLLLFVFVERSMTLYDH